MRSLPTSLVRHCLWLASTALLVAGCGSVTTANPDASQDGVDAAGRPDAAAVLDGSAGQDAAGTDAAGTDAGSGIHGAHHQYVLNHVLYPTSSSQAKSDGFDLDGDGNVDNEFGDILPALASSGIDLQPSLDTEIQNGTIILLADVQATSLSDATGAGFQTYFGANPSKSPCDTATPPNCGLHLDGMTSFSIAADSPTDARVPAVIASSTLAGGPGSLALELGFFGGKPAELDLVGAHAAVDQVSTTGLMSGRLGGGITEAQINNVLLPAMTDGISKVVARDCGGMPGMCCTMGTEGAKLVSAFDANNDCVVSAQEVKNTFQSLLAPDVDLLDSSGNYDPNSDGVKDCVSLGVAFSAVDATF